jgi:hypothetical protein
MDFRNNVAKAEMQSRQATLVTPRMSNHFRYCLFDRYRAFAECPSNIGEHADSRRNWLPGLHPGHAD